MSAALQVNKHTAPELLKLWRSTSKAHPVDLYIKDRRVVHMRNWLIKVPCRLMGWSRPVLRKLSSSFWSCQQGMCGGLKLCI